MSSGDDQFCYKVDLTAQQTIFIGVEAQLSMSPIVSMILFHLLNMNLMIIIIHIFILFYITLDIASKYKCFIFYD